MKNNKGFATSFIVFSLLVLFLIVMSILLFTLNGSSTLSSKLKESMINNIETPNIYNEYNYYYSNDVQVFIAPKNRVYNVKAWSSNGNYIFGKISLKKGDKLYIYVGETNYNNGSTDIRTVTGNAYDETSLNSTIMRSSNTLSNSFASEEKFRDVQIKSKDDLGQDVNPSTSNTGHVKIYFYYYSLTAEKVGFDDSRIHSSCDNLQCLIDKMKNMISEE